MKKTLLHLSVLLIAALCLAPCAQARRMAVLSDIHVTPGNACQSALQLAVAEINADSTYDAVFLIGDLTNEGSDVELRNVKSILDSIRHPFFVIPGNHESTWSQSATATFPALWGNDRFVTEIDSLVVVGISCGPFMKMGDGHIKTEDLSWLRSTLQQRVTPGKKVLSLNHYPLNADLDNFFEYAALLSEFPVVAHINGHYHQWQNTTAGGESNTVPNVMVRALDMRDGTYGYTVVDMDNDWMHVYNKPVGAPAQPMFAHPVRTDYKPIKYGKSNWQQPDGFSVKCLWTDEGSVFGRVAADSRNLYLGNSLGFVKAIDRATGTERWSMQTGASVYARPVVLPDGRVAFPNSKSIVIYNPRNGRASVSAENTAPYVADGVVTPYGWLQGGYKRIELHSPRRPERVKWVYDSLFNYCQGAPAIDGSDAVFGAWDTNLRCIDLATGKLRWAWNNGKANNLLGPGNVVPVIWSDKVIIVAPDRYMTAIDRRTGKTLWRDNSHRYRESLGRSEDSRTVYAKTMDGQLVAVDATSPEFKELWTLDMELGYDHAPCIVLEKDGVVYAGSRRGIVTAIDPETHTILWQRSLGTSEVNGFDIAPDGKVLVSLVEGTVWEISKEL